MVGCKAASVYCCVAFLPVVRSWTIPARLHVNVATPRGPHVSSPAPCAATLSRRAALFGALSAPLTIAATPNPALAENSRIDPLTIRLKQSREELDACVRLLENKQWDQVRKIINELLAPMSFNGYLGESVKSRAAAWVAAGELERSERIVARRSKLMGYLSTLQNGVYAAQTSNKQKMLSPDELQATLASASAALDDVIAEMGCERRWASGKCEILPKDRDLSDLVAGNKF